MTSSLLTVWRLCGALSLLIIVCLATASRSYADGPGETTLESAPATLAEAAQRQQWGRLRALLKQANGQPDQPPQPDGMTALHWAVFWNHSEVARQLVQGGMDVNAQTIYAVTPLWIACRAGNAEMANLLIQAGADVRFRRPGNETALMTAARTGRAEVLEALIDAGAETDARDHRGQTALMWAAAEGNLEAVNVLLAAGADPAVKLKSGYTAMFFAARQGQVDVCKRLLASGVDVNAVMRPANTSGRQPRDRMSALMLAVESGHFELAIELVRAGADPNDQRSDFAPLHAVTWVRKTKVGDGVDGDPPPRGSGNLTSLEFVEQIVGLGADVNLALARGKGGRAKMNTKGATPLLMAARTADLPLLKLLAKLGADLERTNIEGCTPLMAAAGIGVTAVGEEPGTESEVIETMMWLVDRGADVDAVDDNGETAMHGAAYRNYPGAVAKLAELGASPSVWNHKNKYGWTPVMIAQGKRPGSFKPSPETIAALRKAM
ncbi:MAG: ankyrin repeat domain-containing protein [Pirellulales bacterium]|nr:ankyrin repeat domain-containing protein [Pirellulales bacterium]